MRKGRRRRKGKKIKDGFCRCPWGYVTPPLQTELLEKGGPKCVASRLQGTKEKSDTFTNV